MMKYFFALTSLSCLLFSASEDPIFGKNGMIVSTSRQASEAGIEILKKGGNAIDAAVAVGFALAVTSSGNGNLGGGGFLVAAMKNGDTFTIDHREKAPKNQKNLCTRIMKEILSMGCHFTLEQVVGCLEQLMDY